MSKTQLPYKQALPLAEKIARELAPVTAKIEIAGSLRRKKAQIGDIEIVCIPLTQVNLFGDPGGSLLDPELEYLIQEGRIIRGDKWGLKYKKFYVPARPELSIPEVPVDLFITTAPEWGYTFTIRTGPSDFSRSCVTPKQQGGYLPGHLRVAECRLWEGATALETPEERDFLEALGVGWIEPEFRS